MTSPDERQEPVSHEHIDYWIDDIEGGVAVFYRNADSEATIAGGSQRLWLNRQMAIASAKHWARENGCGEVEYKPGGPSDG